ncbi:hypothetical protein CAPTEDRAFT_178858 [Capitella teleta]|uniref:Amino acid transporter n=1 Tax=Capitella teleta TaxID=283909 RepID=R7VG62_CAPTE|nr:hypothetical protein CAPTEDRAFT_178858 [Capitella teleta]|eukprot:ELU17609.1 hypothetical protein CAPTEDRAFT_178858 [Capitella teleta]
MEDEIPKRRKCNSCIRTNSFLFALLLGIVIGVTIGLCVQNYHSTWAKDNRNIMYLGYPGELFMRMLKLIIIPLVVTSLIAGMASMPSKATGKLGGITVAYYLSTTLVAVLLGMLLVAIIKPGDHYKVKEVSRERRPVHPADSALDLIRNVFPSNLIGATMEKTVTRYNEILVNVTNETSKVTTLEEEYDYSQYKVVSASGTNILGLVVFSCVFGIIIGKMGRAGEPVLRLMISLQDAIIRLVQLIIWFAPVGICFILASKIGSMENPEEDFTALGYYMLTVLLGLFLHGFIVLPIIYFIVARKNPYKVMYHVSQALLTALGTASSSATMSVTIKNLTEKARLDHRVVNFVVPVGATVNMDGTALYEAVASIFIAQINVKRGVYEALSAADYVVVSLTATLAAIGAAGVPEAGLVTMMIVLEALGLPTDDVYLILAVDWFLDRCRTAINVWGDCVGTALVDHTAQNDLHILDDAQNNGIIIDNKYLESNDPNFSHL